MRQLSNLDLLQMTVTNWSEKTFPASTSKSIYKHLRKEVDELGLALKARNRKRRKRWTGEEVADCILLLMHLSRKQRIMVHREINRKFEINQKRTWGKPNKDGFQEHVRGKK